MACMFSYSSPYREARMTAILVRFTVLNSYFLITKVRFLKKIVAFTSLFVHFNLNVEQIYLFEYIVIAIILYNIR